MNGQGTSNKFLIIIWLLGMAAPALAGQVTIRGTSKISHKAEYISVRINIASQCYSSQKAVREVTNGAAEKMKNLLKTFINNADDSRDQILALPGYTVRSTLRRQDPESGHLVVVCEQGWHESNTLILRLANYERWPEVQEALLEVADSYKVEATQPGTTDLTISEPQPRLYEETEALLAQKAKSQALANASRQFKEIAAQCGLYNHRIVSMETDQPSYPNARLRMAASEESGHFEPEFDEITVQARWTITWEYVDTGVGCTPPAYI